MLELFLKQNRVLVIRDTNEENSFGEFMDQIETCDVIIFLLSNAFFDSVYCTYEMLIWAECGIRAVPIYMSHLDIMRPDIAQEKYNNFKEKIYMLSENQCKKVDKVIPDNAAYNNIVNKLLNERWISWNISMDFEHVCNDVFYKIFKRTPRNKHVNNAHEILEYHLRELENIKDESLQIAFFRFLSDLVRCSSLIMSPYDEDAEGEELLRLKDYHVNYGQIGASIRMEVLDVNNVYKKIEIYDIIGLERNQDVFNKEYIRYYFVIRDRHLYRDLINEERKPERIRNKEVIDKYERLGVNRQRCTLYFQDKNACETFLCDRMVIVSMVNKKY